MSRMHIREACEHFNIKEGVIYGALDRGHLKKYKRRKGDGFRLDVDVEQLKEYLSNRPRKRTPLKPVSAKNGTNGHKNGVHVMKPTEEQIQAIVFPAPSLPTANIHLAKYRWLCRSVAEGMLSEADSVPIMRKTLALLDVAE